MRYFLIAFLIAPLLSFGQAIKVEIISNDNGYQLLRDGKPYYVNGVGGETKLEEAVSFGANSFRTWSTDNAKEKLDKAHELGMTVCMGFWAQHERHGFDWSNELAVQLQLESFSKVVDELKDHPALLMWAVGNEVDLFYSNFDVWKHIEDITKMIKEKDSNHPVMTVTAGLDVAEIKLIQKFAPSLDLIGINTYGGLNFAIEALPKYGWKKPYMITEWGPNGHWESPNTSWGTPIEQTSTEKAVSYAKRYDYIYNDMTNCLGSYVFLWGFKQETTDTWYGLFLKDGSQTDVMDELIYKWSGKYPDNRAPKVSEFLINDSNVFESVTVQKGAKMNVSVVASDANGDDLTYHYSIKPESTNTKAGGDYEESPKEIYSKVSSNNNITIKAPSKEGPYRLFIKIRDGKKAATANFPFLVE